MELDVRGLHGLAGASELVAGAAIFAPGILRPRFRLDSYSPPANVSSGNLVVQCIGRILSHVSPGHGDNLASTDSLFRIRSRLGMAGIIAKG